jgi:hypothetical protein
VPPNLTPQISIAGLTNIIPPHQLPLLIHIATKGSSI